MNGAELARDDGSQSIGTNDHTRAIHFALPVSRFPCRYASHGAAFVHEAIDLHAFAHDGAGRFRRAAQNRVEPDARQREAERLKAPRDSVAARRHDFHSCEMRRGCRRDRGQHIRAQPLEHSGRFRAQVLGARLLAREVRAVEQQHARARARQ